MHRPLLRTTDAVQPWRCRQWAVVVLAMAALSVSGCFWLAAGAVGGGALGVYYEGRLQQTLNADLAKCHRAAEETLADQKLPVIEDRADAVTAHLGSRYADDKRVWIDMEAVGSGSTKVTIRVGVMGDKDRSLTILDGIKRRAGL
jgi:hypothetical protein